MAHIKRSYIDSHWLIFIIKGIIAVLFGWYALFNIRSEFTELMSVIGIFLLSLSIIEFVNALYRARQKTGWAVSVGIAVADAIVGLALLFTLGQDATWQLVLLAAYTFIRGFCEIVSGFRTTIDPTDRFTWVFGGMCGAIMGLVIFNSGIYFIRFFGAYLLILGVCSLVYGVHNRAQKLEDKEARIEAATARKAALKKSTRKAKKSRK